MRKTILLAGMMVLAFFAGNALAAPFYYYGEQRATPDYFNSIDPLIGSPYYPETARTYSLRGYFFHRNYPVSALSMAYEPLRSEERFPYGNVYSYDPFTGLTYLTGSKGYRPFDYRYNQGLGSAWNGQGLSGRSAGRDPSGRGQGYQYLDGVAYKQPAAASPGFDFDTYARGVTYR
ncbi:MAG TPA: hypothetical protein HA252_05685 [Candidatus Diapherotrites archaeon]|uniref:Uncharacterized protein n=1 Tax=Candidatus Iainarchaeum sp. TaxID=3101447 RepID=A0A7J4JGQ3_9ARCH|nr:hypothetical protein [Candidatus Diapherotrites archaeon]HIH16868.1 hypothetical protein [Candidatus Diapherotrites archaeon]